MLNLAYCVKDGIDFMENPVNQGDDFYLALEDNKRRIKKDRVVKLGIDKSL